ncbi:group II intron maturase-specific domain-containing protein [Botryobacter ruber]|uniref:group II intron maturase-specific domain-containing protein n=1 Tax=Botryobacter ruber TaxID=2171629 RepID=UPI001F0BBA2E|nr:group II intron maturase-specific domain-containing protein [Botryobacter ruber]
MIKVAGAAGMVAGTAKEASIQGKLKDIDSWIRNRLRHCIWHDWKRPERKRKNLIRLGVPKGQAYAWSRTRKGGWAVAQSPMLITTVTGKRLVRRGYESLLDYYKKVAPQLNEPLYTRPVGSVNETVSLIFLMAFLMLRL